MRNGIFGVLPTRKMGQEPKIKDGSGGGEGRKAGVSFLPSPPPPPPLLSLAPFFAL